MLCKFGLSGCNKGASGFGSKVKSKIRVSANKTGAGGLSVWMHFWPCFAALLRCPSLIALFCFCSSLLFLFLFLFALAISLSLLSLFPLFSLFFEMALIPAPVITTRRWVVVRPTIWPTVPLIAPSFPLCPPPLWI